ncbi:hypothetical protein AALB39_04390 [Lachnospiraceae bacterium 54-53]
MSKHLKSQRYVFKIHSSRLRRAKWNLKLTSNQARETKELIALSESQVLRFIDEINGVNNSELKILEVKSKIRRLKQEKNLSVSRPRIKKLYEDLDKYLVKTDYVCVVIDDNKDYVKMFKSGFKINGVTYKRLLGTTGGVKNNTIVFVNDKLLPELNKRIDNGRDLNKEFTPAKLEAYKSLVCSSSIPVSYPNGIVVVHDCITHFKADVIELDDTGLEQPSMKFIKDKDMELNDSDGYGLAMPCLMERWGEEIGEDYLLPGCVIRNSFCKGAVFPVDFQEFAKKHEVTTITDVWGNSHNINEVELILTESMLKLWDSYSSMDEYLSNCKKNNYTFAITKSSEEKLENVRTMNYQFLQSYEFTDDQIDELVSSTVNEIRDVLSDDYRKSILYTKGTNLTESAVQNLDSTFATALMIEPLMYNDPYIRGQIRSMIQKRIDEAKVGVLNVPANYSLVSGDPYSLCQSMLGLKVTGLLKAGEVYSKYWVERGVNKIASFRAPMTSHNNIRLLNVVHSKEMDDFYKYMTTPTIFNSWDTCADAMNGFDKDGDCVINTSSSLIVENTRELPAIVCVQRKAPKCIPDDEILMRSNINSFGNAVGEVTNKITSMFEKQANFEKGSREWNVLDYRIKCGQLYQQNEIDKTKGIEANPMPDKWYSWISNKISKGKDAEEKKRNWFNRKLIVDKKPYFMKYIYPAEKAAMNNYRRENESKSIMRFRLPLDELLSKKGRTPQENEFVKCYYDKMPLGMAPCTINKICWKIEKTFNAINMSEPEDFDYSILKSNADYSKELYGKIKKIYEKYKRDLSRIMADSKKHRIKSDELADKKHIFTEDFRMMCFSQCPNEEMLGNIILDICYSDSKHSKQFAWDMCGDVFIKNLLKKRNYKISYPTKDDNGDIEFSGERFSMVETDINVELNISERRNNECPLY